MSQRYENPLLGYFGNVDDPQLPTDAANKRYVDSRSSSIYWDATNTSPFGTIAVVATSGSNSISFSGNVTSSVPANQLFVLSGDTTLYTVTSATFNGTNTVLAISPNLNNSVTLTTVGYLATRSQITDLRGSGSITGSVSATTLTLSAPGTPTLVEPSWRTVSRNTTTNTLTVTDNPQNPAFVLRGNATYSGTSTLNIGSTGEPVAGDGDSVIQLTQVGGVLNGLATPAPIGIAVPDGTTLGTVLASASFLTTFFTNISLWTATFQSPNSVVFTYNGSSPVILSGTPSLQLTFTGGWTNSPSATASGVVSQTQTNQSPAFGNLASNHIIPAINGTPTNGQVPTYVASTNSLNWQTPSSGGGITSINTQTGPAVNVVAGTGIGISSAGNNITVTNTGSGSIASGNFTSFNAVVQRSGQSTQAFPPTAFIANSALDQAGIYVDITGGGWLNETQTLLDGGAIGNTTYITTATRTGTNGLIFPVSTTYGEVECQLFSQNLTLNVTYNSAGGTLGSVRVEAYFALRGLNASSSQAPYQSSAVFPPFSFPSDGVTFLYVFQPVYTFTNTGTGSATLTIPPAQFRAISPQYTGLGGTNEYIPYLRVLLFNTAANPAPLLPTSASVTSYSALPSMRVLMTLPGVGGATPTIQQVLNTGNTATNTTGNISTLILNDSASGSATTLDGTKVESRVLQLDGSTSGNMQLRVPATTTSYALTLPNALPTAQSFVETDATGAVSFRNTQSEIQSGIISDFGIVRTDGINTSPVAIANNSIFGTNITGLIWSGTSWGIGQVTIPAQLTTNTQTATGTFTLALTNGTLLAVNFSGVQTGTGAFQATSLVPNNPFVTFPPTVTTIGTLYLGQNVAAGAVYLPNTGSTPKGPVGTYIRDSATVTWSATGEPNTFTANSTGGSISTDVVSVATSGFTVTANAAIGATTISVNGLIAIGTYVQFTSTIGDYFYQVTASTATSLTIATPGLVNAVTNGAVVYNTTFTATTATDLVAGNNISIRNIGGRAQISSTGGGSGVNIDTVTSTITTFSTTAAYPSGTTSIVLNATGFTNNTLIQFSSSSRDYIYRVTAVSGATITINPGLITPVALGTFIYNVGTPAKSSLTDLYAGSNIGIVDLGNGQQQISSLAGVVNFNNQPINSIAVASPLAGTYNSGALTIASQNILQYLSSVAVATNTVASPNLTAQTSTIPILSGLPVIDGYQVKVGDRVLYKDTGTQTGVTFTASGGAGSNQLTVGSVTGGLLQNPLIVTNPNILANTYIVAQLSGTFGGAGTYLLSQVQTSGSSGTYTASPSTLTAANYGIYVAAAGLWARASDASTPAQLRNAVVLIANGTINAGNSFFQANSNINTVGVDSQQWLLFSQNGASSLQSTLAIGRTANTAVAPIFNTDAATTVSIGTANLGGFANCSVLNFGSASFGADTTGTFYLPNSTVLGTASTNYLQINGGAGSGVAPSIRTVAGIPGTNVPLQLLQAGSAPLMVTNTTVTSGGGAYAAIQLLPSTTSLGNVIISPSSTVTANAIGLSINAQSTGVISLAAQNANYVTVAGSAAAASGPQISVVGGDTNINLRLASKGTGTVQVVGATATLNISETTIARSGTGNLSLLAGTNAGDAIILGTNNATTPNNIAIFSATAGSGATLTAQGTDANIPLVLTGKGTSGITIGSNLVNYWMLSGGSATNPVALNAVGSDANIGMNINGKGNGSLTLSNVNCGLQIAANANTSVTLSPNTSQQTLTTAQLRLAGLGSSSSASNILIGTNFANYWSFAGAATPGTGNPTITCVPAGLASTTNIQLSGLGAGNVILSNPAQCAVQVLGNQLTQSVLQATSTAVTNCSLLISPQGTGNITLGDITGTNAQLQILTGSTSQLIEGISGGATNVDRVISAKGTGTLIALNGLAFNSGSTAAPAYGAPLLAANAATAPTAMTAGTAGQVLVSRGASASPAWVGPVGYLEGSYTSSAGIQNNTDTLLNWANVSNNLSALSYSGGVFTANRACSVSFSMQVVFTSAGSSSETDIWFSKNGVPGTGTRFGQSNFSYANTTTEASSFILTSSWTFRLAANDTIRMYCWCNSVSTTINIGNAAFGGVNSRCSVVELTL